MVPHRRRDVVERLRTLGPAKIRSSVPAYPVHCMALDASPRSKELGTGDRILGRGEGRLCACIVRKEGGDERNQYHGVRNRERPTCPAPPGGDAHDVLAKRADYALGRVELAVALLHRAAVVSTSIHRVHDAAHRSIGLFVVGVG